MPVVPIRSILVTSPLHATNTLRQLAKMAAPTWSSVAKDPTYTGGSRTFATQNNDNSNNTPNSKPSKSSTTPNPRQKRGPSPSHIPKTSSSSEQVYVLTLTTDPAHQEKMTSLRNTYFPKNLNKLGAHLTLFHALPQSQLETAILPAIRTLASKISPFPIHAARPFRMKKGIAISVPRHEGGEAAQRVHGELLAGWKGEGWLSEQDAGGMRVHYTIMNKVEDEEVVAGAMEEVKGRWKGDWGEVRGLGLWRYERGWWKWVEGFEFRGGENGEVGE